MTLVVRVESCSYKTRTLNPALNRLRWEVDGYEIVQGRVV